MSHFHWWLMTLGSNILGKIMQNTCSMPYKSTIKSQYTGKDNDTSTLASNGIVTNMWLTYPCLDTSNCNCTGSNTVHHQEKNMHRIFRNGQIMEQPRNSPRQRTHHKNCPQSAYWHYKKSWEHYCFMPKRSI